VTKQQAVTRELHFVLTYASFKPLDDEKKDKMLRDFDSWMRLKGKECDFLVWSSSIKGHVNDQD
jgi:hypothetical protein